MLNNAIKEHNSYSADELKPKRYFKVLDPFLLMQRIHPYLGASKNYQNSMPIFSPKIWKTHTMPLLT